MGSGIPVIFAAGAAARPEDWAADDLVLDGAALADGTAPASAGHQRGGLCPCCVGRPAAAVALTKLFIARVRGEMRPFRRIVIAGGDAAMLRATLGADLLVAAHYRLD
jgi:hypothetical protein